MTIRHSTASPAFSRNETTPLRHSERRKTGVDTIVIVQDQLVKGDWLPEQLIFDEQ